ncbi:MAG: pyruvate:ferredoxin (flavodoxin) oxidoreductase, partial [Oscillospiraceae bacterium]
FDGFRTSHEIQKVKVWDYSELGEMLDMNSVNEYRRRSLNPEHPVLRGSAQNPDIFFQAREACNNYYDNIVTVTEDYMNEVNKRIGTDYKLFNYYGAPDAERVIVAMGSVCDTIEETIDYLNANGQKVGLVKVRLYRPFSAKHLISAVPETVKSISVIDRTKEPGSLGEPLFLDVVAALKDSKFSNIPIYAGRYGLGSKDTHPGTIISVYDNMSESEPKKHFTIGIEDDVTHLSLKVKDTPDTTPKGTTSCKFWGLGADGTVGANKNSIKIIGDNTDMYAQGYFAYDSKKSGGVTISHLRFGEQPIKSTYLISKADFVACHNPSYVDKYKMVEDLKQGGTFLLNCHWNLDELTEKLPASVKNFIAKNNIEFYTINATEIAKELGLGGRVNTILQAAFFNLSKIIPSENAVTLMKDAATRSYGKKGQKIVDMNHAAIERGVSDVNKVEVPASWATAVDTKVKAVEEIKRKDIEGFVNTILHTANSQLGDTLPVSTFIDMADGTFPQGSAAYEKRGIAIDVPVWQPDNCIQCNFCSYVCPHGVIRPIAMTAEEKANAPQGTKSIKLNGVDGYEFAMTISSLDCTGCGSCAQVCPGKKGEKALVMQSLESQVHQQKIFNYAHELPAKEEVLAKFTPETVKGSQFLTPLLEYSGACAGCGETPYAKLVTQLYGDRMYIANATGCSSIWGGSAPSTPYTLNKDGHGPAWSNSLFEDNAEFGYGMMLANKQIRARLADHAKVVIDCDTANAELKSAAKAWLETYDDGAKNKAAAIKFKAELKNAKPANDCCKKAIGELIEDSDYLAKKSMWIFGGDGWAYDIGFGGLDHVIAQNEDVNILVFDTEVYSNTGGQASKSTPTGAVAQFAASGKVVKKKDLAQIAMSYGYVYVAQVAMGADYNQCLKAFREAENYHGPSIIIAYAPCINHGIKGGMGVSMNEEVSAVKAGYWHNFRFNPALTEDGKNPFTLDSKEPSTDYKDFILGEVRYSSLKRSFPERADVLFDKSAEFARQKYQHLVKLQDLYDPNK